MIPMALNDNSTSGNIQRDQWGVFSKKVANIVTIVNLLILSTGLSLFGIVTNIINIIVFTKQGFQDTVNITLFAVAISDTWACLTLLWTAVCFNPLWVNVSVPFVTYEVAILTGGGPHHMALNTTAWLTAFVTFERCICISVPLKVKAIVTTTRTKALAVMIPIMAIACKVPFYYTTRLGWKFDPKRNKTLVGLVFLENSEITRKVTFLCSDVLSSTMSFSVVVVCTLVLVVKLRAKTKWRQTSAATVNKEDSSAKEKKVIKMVVTVAAVFIINYTPKVVVVVWMAMEPQFSPYGKYASDYKVAYNTASIFESLNASLNIFVFFHMSTKYRTVFCEIFSNEDGTSKIIR